MLNINNSDGQAPDAFRRGHYGLANLLYMPLDNVTLGGEFQWGRRENFRDGFAVNDFRIQFSFKYAFSKVLKFEWLQLDELIGPFLYTHHHGPITIIF